MKINRKQQGFTIVELLIVIVVIGILAALVITTYTGIQAKARNSKRQTDVQSIQTQLEAYFAQNGHYPSLTDMNDSSWLTTNMKSLDVGALKDPQGSGSTLVTAPVAKSYAYAVANSGGTSCESDDTTCATYTLTATLEGGGTYAKSNLD
ncbi:MAG TPA: prepilin-type N-terminal cleavage/methylation domain-containing protein [Candidatus Saccharimonadales bacterium]|nr:prepilin-type N-terminal cleavage/methylation domain-containing protein [Candidatus Saccharimonadales bacterium]